MPISKRRRLAKKARQQEAERKYWARALEESREREKAHPEEDLSDLQLVEEWCREEPENPFYPALLEDLRVDGTPGCICCVANALCLEAERQVRMKRRHGSAWHGGIHFRHLRRVRFGSVRCDPDANRKTHDFLRWMEQKGLVRRGQGKYVWVHFYRE